MLERTFKHCSVTMRCRTPGMLLGGRLAGIDLGQFAECAPGARINLSYAKELTWILTRRPGDTIRINDRVRVTVLRVKANQVHIGIEAPASVSVDREEVWQRKQREAKLAHAAPPPRLTLTLSRPIRQLDEPIGPSAVLAAARSDSV